MDALVDLGWNTWRDKLQSEAKADQDKLLWLFSPHSPWDANRRAVIMSWGEQFVGQALLVLQVAGAGWEACGVFAGKGLGPHPLTHG